MTTRTRKSREEFVKEMNTRIAARNIIMEFVENVYFPLMATKFDGKVYNARFINALNDEAKKTVCTGVEMFRKLLDRGATPTQRVESITIALSMTIRARHGLTISRNTLKNIKRQ